MLKIAICDDVDVERRRIENLILEYRSAKKLQLEIDLFEHPDDLQRACERKQYAIYILDVVMPMVNGVELGREIRKMDQECQIIYITTTPEYALASFVANPINYLLKPIEKEKLFQTMDLAVSKLEKIVDKAIVVKCKDSMRVINLEDILFCEYKEHRIIYHLGTGEQLLSVTIRVGFTEQLETLLQDKRFIQTHSSYICNMNTVEKMTGSGFILRDGMEVPISKKLFAEVRDAYLDYRLGREEAF